MSKELWLERRLDWGIIGGFIGMIAGVALFWLAFLYVGLRLFQ
jgi:hypothetical protein